MKLSIWLLIACIALTIQSHAQELTLFDADPAHPWNQLYAALHTDVKVKDAETFEAYEKDALTAAKYGETLALLDRFLRRKQHRSIRDPIKRAILQSATWAAFNAASNPNGRFQEQRRAIAQRLGEIVRRLALTDDEIDRQLRLGAAARVGVLESVTGMPYRRQNAVVVSTSSGKISSLPRTIARMQIQL